MTLDDKCHETVNFRRPDRGPERECRRPAKYFVEGFIFYVCGNHARAFPRSVLHRLRKAPR